MSGEADTIPQSDRFGEARHPRETSVFFGHAEAEAALLSAYRSGRLAHAWIIAGREGIGKATLAWRFARFVLVRPHRQGASLAAARDLSVPPDLPAVRQVETLSHPDLVLLRREWNEKGKRHYTEIRVDEVRGAARVFQRAPSDDGYRICIIDSADDLNRSAANALLKLIEEPPARSLFLIVAHRPGRILPTIRSRCRMLLLQPLPSAEIVRAVEASGAAQGVEPDRIRAAAEHAQGSVRTALQLLDSEAADLRERVSGLLSCLPAVDWREVHRLAESVASREAIAEYEVLNGCVLDWLAAAIRGRAGGPAAQLAPYAQVWEKYGLAARDAEAFNLDRRPLILSLFADLVAAARLAQG